MFTHKCRWQSSMWISITNRRKSNTAVASTNKKWCPKQVHLFKSSGYEYSCLCSKDQPHWQEWNVDVYRYISKSCNRDIYRYISKCCNRDVYRYISKSCNRDVYRYISKCCNTMHIHYSIDETERSRIWRCCWPVDGYLSYCIACNSREECTPPPLSSNLLN